MELVEAISDDLTEEEFQELCLFREFILLDDDELFDDDDWWDLDEGLDGFFEGGE